VIDLYGLEAEARLKPYFERAKVPYPPKRIALLAFKNEKSLELWADAGKKAVFVRSYTIRAASGGPGPKLRQGDRQVPEGLYRIESLNPNSSYHLSMKVNYPNDYDKQKAKEQGRTKLGGDIFIHGKAVSIGCLAMGDTAIEELFVLAARIGYSSVEVIIAPNDLRSEKPIISEKEGVPWLGELYEILRKSLTRFRKE